MVTTETLRKQIKEEQSKIERAKKRQKLQFEKIGLEKQLKMLKRSPTTSKNIELAQRTGRGLKRIASFTGRALVKQAKLIKEQQLRDDAAQKMVGKKISKTAKTTRKKAARRAKKTGKSISKGLRKRGKSVTLQFN